MLDAPIPIVGISIFLVTIFANDVSTHSNTIEKTPADSNNCASFKILLLSEIFLPLNLNVLSVVLTGALATYMANYIQKHIWIAYVGLIFILVVGLQLIIGGLVDLEILKVNEEFIKYF